MSIVRLTSEEVAQGRDLLDKILQCAVSHREGNFREGDLIDLFPSFSRTFKTERVYAVYPEPRRGLSVISSMSKDFSQKVRAHFRGYDKYGNSQFVDAYSTRLHQIVRSMPAGAVHDAPLWNEKDHRSTRIYEKIFREAGVQRQLAVCRPARIGEHLLVLAYDGRDVPEYGGTRHQMLSLLSPAIERMMQTVIVEHSGETCLSTREREVAELLARGLSDKEVARLLAISHHTARRHSESILRKLGISTRRYIGQTMLTVHRAID
jgi:DNA-binding CsgD family transcriptional regulator